MLELDEKQKNVISQKIGCFYQELVLKYETNKYTESVYDQLLGKFSDLDDVEAVDINRALAWKYGKSLANLSKNKNHESTRYKINDAWKDFVAKGFSTGEDIFHYWISVLPTSFITAAFIAHLCKPEEVPIVDQHNFRAVRYFLSLVNLPNNLKQTPNTWDEIYLLKNFIDIFVKKLSVSSRELDKYLMMFGKHVAPRRLMSAI